jgi:hypothetical protein
MRRDVRIEQVAQADAVRHSRDQHDMDPPTALEGGQEIHTPPVVIAYTCGPRWILG